MIIKYDLNYEKLCLGKIFKYRNFFEILSKTVSLPKIFQYASIYSCFGRWRTCSGN
jgi:hypothetical protein